MKKDYQTESIKLAKAIDIAIDAYSKYPPKDFQRKDCDHVISVYYEWKNDVLNPEPQYRKIASLKYHIEAVFTYFQEASGQTVEYFWKQISNENLDFKREDKLRKIINRGKIKNHIEYDLVIDSFVAAEQEGRISSDESVKLSEMIGEFENRKKKK